ncbi:MAG: hypothetical protein DRN14_00070 [Thermoplasmata archaeon]|nr:MAG: hypothetical protein DRN14_00070 [Thermoplasmata archaeon]
MANIDDLTRLKRLVEKRQTEADKAAGALEEAMKSLHAEFGCDNISEAKTMLKTLEKKEAALKKKFDKALDEFLDKWGDELE